MLLKPNVLGGVAANPVSEERGGGTQANSPALIGMSLRQDIPGGLLSSRARFRFSCQGHSETKNARTQQKRSEQRTVTSLRVSKLDTAQTREVTPPPPACKGRKSRTLILAPIP
jgi:hypothetical protein